MFRTEDAIKFRGLGSSEEFMHLYRPTGLLVNNKKKTFDVRERE